MEREAAGEGREAAKGGVEREAARLEREKLNRQMAQICDLRAVVPYIAELSARVARLEAEARQAAAARWEPSDLQICDLRRRRMGSWGLERDGDGRGRRGREPLGCGVETRV